MNTFDINILINTHCLLKIDNAEEADVVITVAFWCIYKMLILRNKYGFDDRMLKLRYLFEREIKNRIIINKKLISPDKKLQEKLLSML